MVQSVGHCSQISFLTTKLAWVHPTQPIESWQLVQFVGHVTHRFVVLKYAVDAHVRHSPEVLQVAQSEGHSSQISFFGTKLA